MTRTENIDPLILISHVIFTLLASQAFKKWPNTIFGRINARYILAQELKLNSLIITQSCTPCKDTLHTHTSCYAQESSFWKNRRRIISFFQFPRIRKHLSWETALQHKSLYFYIFVHIYYPSSSHTLLVKLFIHHVTLRFMA